jgi:cytochrome c-type biogenesis protein CcmH
MTRRLVVLAAALLLTAPAPTALAAPCPRTSLAALENEVMCLVCGVPLALADAAQAERERVFIARMVDRCKSKDEIEAALVAQYGPRVLALPRADGFRLAAYLVPIFGAAGLGLAAGGWRRRRQRTRGAGLSVAAPPLDPLDAARIEAELDRYRR